MNKYSAMSGAKRICTVWADTEDEARAEIKRELNESGRRELYQLWVRDGEEMKVQQAGKVMIPEADQGVKRTLLLLNMPLRRALEAAANARAMTMSAWIREAIQEKLEREGRNGKP